MTTIHIKLTESKPGEWRLYAPLGHAIGGPYRGTAIDAKIWATAWISGWSSWSITTVEGESDEKKS